MTTPSQLRLTYAVHSHILASKTSADISRLDRHRGILFFSNSRGLLKEGDMAPDFSAKLTTGEVISLMDYRGKKNVVLFFYPKDFTSGCTEEVCSFRDNYQALQKYDAVLLGVSADDEDSHRAFIKQHGLPFPLVSDTDKSIARAYGTATRFMGLVRGSKRVTYVIDRSGRIQNVIHHEVLIGKHIAGVVFALKRLSNERD